MNEKVTLSPPFPLFAKKPRAPSPKALCELAARLAERQNELDRRERCLAKKIDTGRIHPIPPLAIQPGAGQPRRRFDDASLIALAESVRLYGILQPLTVRPMPMRERSGGVDTPPSLFASAPSLQAAAENTVAAPPFELIAGERRLRAAMLLGLETVPCIIIETDDASAAEISLIENLQRENLNMFEQAGAIAALIDVYGLRQEEIAQKLSVSQSFVANKLRILRFTEGEREVMLEAGLCERHARALLRLRDVEARRAALAEVVRRRMNVAATEAYVDHRLTAVAPAVPARRTRIVLKDIRMFFNSIEKAVETCKCAGVDIFSQREETDGEIVWVLRIPKSAANTAERASVTRPPAVSPQAEDEREAS